MPRVLHAALIALTLVGCASREAAYRIVFDPCGAAVVADGQVSPDELAAIDAALAMWNASGELGIVRLDADPNSAVRVRFEAAATPFRGLYDAERGMVWINREISDPEARAVIIAHELGHAFGLSHVAVADRASVMNPGTAAVPPTDADLALLRALWGDCREARPSPGS